MPKKPDPNAQRQHFIETARAIGANEDEAAFKEKLARIARQKPKDEPAPTPAKPRARRKPKAG